MSAVVYTDYYAKVLLPILLRAILPQTACEISVFLQTAQSLVLRLSSTNCYGRAVQFVNGCRHAKLDLLARCLICTDVVNNILLLIIPTPWRHAVLVQNRADVQSPPFYRHYLVYSLLLRCKLLVPQ